MSKGKSGTQMTHVALAVCLFAVSCFYIEAATASPVWRPQGRFGKRLDSGFLIDSAKAPLSGEIEFPVEALASNERPGFLRVLTRLCTVSGVPGYQPCGWSSAAAEETTGNL